MQTHMKRLDERAVIVTGGGSGIGEASVRRFYGEGASVLVLDANIEKAQKVADSIGDPKRVFAKPWRCLTGRRSTQP